MGEMEAASMPRIVRYDENRIASFLRGKMYAEALACAAETKERLLPTGGAYITSDVGLLVRVMLAQCAAHMHLKQYRDSRLAAWRAHQIIRFYCTQAPEADNTYEMLAKALEDLEHLAKLRNLIAECKQADCGQSTSDIELAMQMQTRCEAKLIERAISLMQCLGDLIISER
jgi:predicted Zn-dependent protease